MKGWQGRLQGSVNSVDVNLDRGSHYSSEVGNNNNRYNLR